jgi:hypothetical protein
MLIRGDLVSIPQGSYVRRAGGEHDIKLPREIKSKKYGVILECRGEEYEVLIMDSVYEINKKFLQLVEAA